MISASDRGKAIELIDEAVISGARLFKACNELGITERTYYRWIKLNFKGTVLLKYFIA
jgi:putative transposase